MIVTYLAGDEPFPVVVGDHVIQLPMANTYQSYSVLPGPDGRPEVEPLGPHTIAVWNEGKRPTMTSAEQFAAKMGITLPPRPVARPAEAPVSKCDRPTAVLDMIGDDVLRAKLIGRVRAAKLRGKPFPHALLFGPPGCGKTTLAQLIAIETGGKLKEVLADAIEGPRALIHLFAELDDGDVLFIDEIHGLSTRLQRTFYKALEDGMLEVTVGTGAKAEAVRQPLRNFVVVGATTDPGKLPEPLQERFGFKGAVRHKTVEELTEIILKAAERVEPRPVKIGEDAAENLARRSRGTPRVAKNLLEIAYDFAVADAGDPDVPVTSPIVDVAMQLEEIDARGLTRQDRDLLETMCRDHKGGPVGLLNLAAGLGIDNRTLDRMIEPFLIRERLIMRRSSGRVVTNWGWRATGREAPASAPVVEELTPLPET